MPYISYLSTLCRIVKQISNGNPGYIAMKRGFSFDIHAITAARGKKSLDRHSKLFPNRQHRCANDAVSGVAVPTGV